MTISPNPASAPRVALVTGSTNGLGHAVIRHLMAGRTTVILHGPTPAAVDAARERIALAGLDTTRLETEVADFTRLDEVAALADRVAARHPVLDVLVNNAALAPTDTRTVTADGHELAHQVNYLAPYLLTRSLWDPLMAARPARVINLSSSLHRTANLNWGDLERERNYSRTGAYAQSKLALAMFTRAVAVAAGGRIESVSVHPGNLATGLLPLYARFGEPAAEGAQVVARLCDRGTPIRNGAYYDRENQAPSAPLAADDKAVARLWKATAKALELDRQPAAAR
jgi:NAD(P)-dependent dehydrogenase (short-subunit alcohol dehydrogenase family)